MRKYQKPDLVNTVTKNASAAIKHGDKYMVKIAIAAILLLGAVYWLYSKGGSNKAGHEQPPVNVATASVTLTDVPNVISLVGTVYAYETVALKSRIDSQVTKVAFKDGDLVTEGDVLFELDDSIIKAQLNQARANLKRDEAQLENSRSQYERYKKLSKKGFASGEKMEEAAATFKAQVASVNATKAQIDSINAQLNFTTITAPITGRAGTISVTRGNTVKANDSQPLVIINRVQPIRVQFAIPQRYYDELRQTSDSTEIIASRSSTGEEIAKGQLEYIDNTIDPATGSFNARASFANEDEKLWPGMFVNISVSLNEDKNVLVVPQVAVQSGQDGAFVFVVNSDNKAIQRPVEVLRMQDNAAIIKTGLQEGEAVIIDGLLRLNDGAAVAVTLPAADGNNAQ